MTTRRLACIAAIGLLPAWGDGGPAAPRATALSAFGRCDAQHVDGAPADGFVSRDGAWLRVKRIDLPPTYEHRSTRAFAGSYDVVGGDGPAVTALGGSSVSTLTMHGTIARDVAAALVVTPDVYAHVGADAKEVEFALALAGDDFAFLGECQERLLTSPLRRTLGPGAATVVRGFVGKTGAQVAMAFPRASARPTGVVILNPETVSADVLAGLKVARLRLDNLPASWRGPYTLCTRIAQGWSDCVDLAQSETATIPADAYFDPAAPSLEIWLTNQSADLAHPLARLATVDLDALAKEAAVPLEEGLTVVVTLSATSSPTAAAKDPAQAAGSIARIVARKS